MTVTFCHERDTKNFAVFKQQGGALNNSLYLEKNKHPESFTVEIPEK